MRDYSKIRPQFWVRGTGRRLRGDGDAQRVAFYLMTGPQTHMTGIFYCPLTTLMHEVGIDPDPLARALARLEGEGFAYFDPDADLFWVPNGAREQIGQALKPGDKQVVGILKYLRQYETHSFFNEFVRLYREAYHLPVKAPPEGHAKGPLTPREGSTKTLPKGPAHPLGSQDQDQEQEQEQEPLPEPPSEAPPGPRPAQLAPLPGLLDASAPTAPAEPGSGVVPVGTATPRRCNSTDIERVFSEKRKVLGKGSYRLQRSDFDRAQQAVAWAREELPSDPLGAVELSIDRYLQHATGKPREEGFPFWGWANDPARWFASARPAAASSNGGADEPDSPTRLPEALSLAELAAREESMAKARAKR